jgi:hypothetical protein
MSGTRLRIAVACIAAVAAAVVAAGGSAGPRQAQVTFEAFPGPGEVSYGEKIAYKTTFKNNSGTTLTKVMFRQRFPVADGQYAAPVKSTCPSTPTTITTASGPEWICDFGTQSASAAQLTLIIVWQLPPTLTSTSNCPDCLETNGRWTVKEGTTDVSDPNDAIPPNGITVFATLLASGAGGGETLKAGGFETDGVSCATATSPGNLQTNPDVGLTNPVASTLCLPSFTAFGHAATITETAGDAHHSLVCIAALGTSCGPSHVDATFPSPFVTHIFRVADAALENGEKITVVRHNGVPLASCADDPNNANGCATITPPTGPGPKIWVIVATSPTNGPWDW